MSVATFKRNLVPLLCIALVAASVATAVFYGLFGSKLREISASAPRQPVVVAARNLRRGVVVKAADVKLSTWGGAEPLQGGYEAIDQVVGKTVFDPVRENEPVMRARTASADGADGTSIVAGMRAVSVHASDSSGVLSLLSAGDKVDVQVVSDQPDAKLKLRTILQNAEVLGIDPGEPGGRPTTPVVTLVVSPAAADRLALADSGARLRLLLRNPLDRSEDDLPSLALANIFVDDDGTRESTGAWDSGSTPGTLPGSIPGTVPGSAPVSLPDVARTDGVRVQLLVRVAGVQPAAIEQLAALSHSSQLAMLQVVPFPLDPAFDQAVRALTETHQFEEFSSTRLTAGNHRRVSMQVGAAWGNRRRSKASGACGLRLQFAPSLDGAGNLRVRVQPLVTSTSRSQGVAIRKMETEVELVDGQSFLVSGLSDKGDWPVLARRLFARPAEPGVSRELVALVTVQVLKPVPPAALASRR
jgi:Flp pilus assembly protein CpaB